jgi:hypothetical protein
MAAVPGVPGVGGGAGGGGAGGGPEAAIAKMEAAFNRAIEMSAKVTEITTEKKAQLDAAKQRPQN